MTAGTTIGAKPRRKVKLIPNQHGAWAFLFVPLVLGFVAAGWTLIGAAFALAWTAAYPMSYYSMRLTRVLLRRRRLTPAARRDLQATIVWSVPVILLGAPLVLARPALLVVAGVAAILWTISLWLSVRGQERGLANDLLLIAQAVCAVPLLWAVTSDTWSLSAFPAIVWILTLLCAVYFTGTVLHVKSLIRKAADRRWHWSSVAYHAAAIPLMTLVAPVFIVPFSCCLARALILKPGTKPAVIGAVELVMSLLVLLAGTLLAVVMSG